MPGGKRRHGDDFDSHFGGAFVFRDPEEVFREFFDGIPFEDLFAGKIQIHLTENTIKLSKGKHCKHQILQVFMVEVLGEASEDTTTQRVIV